MIARHTPAASSIRRRRAAEAPDADALLYRDQRVTRGELAERALRIAGGLREAGVRPGDAVEVSLPRGPQQVAAVFGVLAAGACYVPLDIDQPAARRKKSRCRVRAVAHAGWPLSRARRACCAQGNGRSAGCSQALSQRRWSSPT